MSIAEQFKIQINNDYLIHRENTWDYKSFNSKVSEVIDFSGGKDSYQVMQQYLKNCVEENFWISITRVKQENLENRLLLQKNHFELVEISYEVVCEFRNLKNLNKSGKIKNKYILGEECNLLELENLAERMFHYGRFSEDLFIDKEKSNLRFRNWCHDLYYGDCERIYLHNNKKLIGFMFFENKNDALKLILGGMSPNYSHLACDFWSQVFLKHGKSKKVITTISAANLGILNLYSFFGFKVMNCFSGYRRLFNG